MIPPLQFEAQAAHKAAMASRPSPTTVVPFGQTAQGGGSPAHSDEHQSSERADSKNSDAPACVPADAPADEVDGQWGHVRERRSHGLELQEVTGSSQDLAKLEPAQSFIVTNLQRSNFVRVEHNRLQSHVVRFRPRQFFQQLLVQTLPPIGAVIVWLRSGRAGMVNTMFWPVLLRAYIQYAMFFCVLGAFVVHSYAADSVKPVPVESSWVLLASYVAYRGCIALKYSYMTSVTYRTWFPGVHTARPVKGEQIMAENLLVWMSAGPEHIRRELLYTARQFGVCLNRSSFTLLDPEASGGAYVNAHHSLTLPREDWKLADAIVHIMQKSTTTRLLPFITKVSLCFSLIHGFVGAGIVDAIYNDNWPPTVGGFVFMILMFLLMTNFAFLIAQIASVAYVDYERRYESLSALQDLVSFHPAASTVESYDALDQLANREFVKDLRPRVSLMVTENVHMFLLARRVLLHIGLRYRKRVQAYTSFLVVLTFGIFVYFLVLGTGGQLVSSPTAWQLISDIVFTIGLLVMCLFKGAATNRLTADHSALLNARVLEVEDAIVNVRARGTQGADVGTVLHMLEDARRALLATRAQLHDDLVLRAVTLLGAPATTGLMRTLAAFGTTFLSLVLRMVLSSSSTG